MSGGCKCRSISLKRSLNIRANGVLSERTSCYRVYSRIKFYIIVFFLHFISGVFYHAKHHVDSYVRVTYRVIEGAHIVTVQEDVEGHRHFRSSNSTPAPARVLFSCYSNGYWCRIRRTTVAATFDIAYQPKGGDALRLGSKGRYGL